LVFWAITSASRSSIRRRKGAANRPGSEQGFVLDLGAEVGSLVVMPPDPLVRSAGHPSSPRPPARLPGSALAQDARPVIGQGNEYT
jgi:hypothetical protein